MDKSYYADEDKAAHSTAVREVREPTTRLGRILQVQQSKSSFARTARASNADFDPVPPSRRTWGPLVSKTGRRGNSELICRSSPLWPTGWRVRSMRRDGPSELNSVRCLGRLELAGRVLHGVGRHVVANGRGHHSPGQHDHGSGTSSAGTLRSFTLWQVITANGRLGSRVSPARQGESH
jgi:hypothetical protein